MRLGQGEISGRGKTGTALGLVVAGLAYLSSSLLQSLRLPSLSISSPPPRPISCPMSSVKLHSSIPTSVGHAGGTLQAKSSVLTGVQDAYWSDEEVRSLLEISGSRLSVLY